MSESTPGKVYTPQEAAGMARSWWGQDQRAEAIAEADSVYADKLADHASVNAESFDDIAAVVSGARTWYDQHAPTPLLDTSIARDRVHRGVANARDRAILAEADAPAPMMPADVRSAIAAHRDNVTLRILFADAVNHGVEAYRVGRSIGQRNSIEWTRVRESYNGQRDGIVHALALMLDVSELDVCEAVTAETASRLGIDY